MKLNNSHIRSLIVVMIRGPVDPICMAYKEPSK